MLGISDGELRLWESNQRLTDYYTNNIHTNMDTEFRLHYKESYLYIGGGMNCAIENSDHKYFGAGSYNPQAMDYPFSIGLRIKDHFEIGYKYNCFHPMETYLNDRDVKYKYNGDYKMVFMKFSGDIKLWSMRN